MKKQKIIACIACRLDSTRLFGKPLQLVNDKSILELQIKQLKKSVLIDEIVLAISQNSGNEIFINFAKKNKLKYLIGSNENVLQRLIMAAKSCGGDIIFRTTSEDPFKHWKIIDDVLRDHISKDADFTYPKNLPEGTGYEIMNIVPLEISEKKGNKHDKEHVTTYILRNDSKFKINIFTVQKKFQHPEIRLTVDNPEDLIVVRKIAEQFPKNKLPDLELVINIINKNKKILKINKKFVNANRKWL